ncbi:hypothetical protein ACDH53_18095 [Pseudomonas tremae]|uniref:Uncharacterized protein n=2 Tax=Pseudomonas syringae group TaxID=136849 RepID=A0AB37QWK2_9PSED|nr:MULTISPECIES: hypothetical protein [Pseudomonas syringae group]RMS06252.1 hypothetical protein ALP74_01321 [Pseudomonas coronafaciens pv. garcae]RMS41758.1 hypothetical protein ALP71_200072 [Pseudomonas coronafaciens pv. garcae]
MNDPEKLLAKYAAVTDTLSKLDGIGLIKDQNVMNALQGLQIVMAELNDVLIQLRVAADQNQALTEHLSPHLYLVK